VVGISTAKYADLGIEGIGFGIPINDAVKVAEEMKTNGYVKGRPYLGVSVADLTAQMYTDYGHSTGVYVGSIIPDSGSAKAGMLEGDIIVWRVFALLT
jgi:serine protease Do